jgi:hypothetical protein
MILLHVSFAQAASTDDADAPTAVSVCSDTIVSTVIHYPQLVIDLSSSTSISNVFDGDVFLLAQLLPLL